MKRRTAKTKLPRKKLRHRIESLGLLPHEVSRFIGGLVGHSFVTSERARWSGPRSAGFRMRVSEFCLLQSRRENLFVTHAAKFGPLIRFACMSVDAMSRLLCGPGYVLF